MRSLLSGIFGLAILTTTLGGLAGCAPIDELERRAARGDSLGPEDDEDGSDDGDVGEPGDPSGDDGPARSAVTMTSACPTDGRLSQGFHGKHDGVDLANSKGTAIFAVAAGRVSESGPAQGYGQWIRIVHDDGSMTEYGHMFQRDVAVGDRVEAGERIALMGSEGRSTGPHLHLRTYKSAKKVGAGNGMNPAEYLRARGVDLPCTPGIVRGATKDDGAETVTVSVWKSTPLRSAERLGAQVLGQAAANTTYPATCWKEGGLVKSDGYTNDRWVKITVGGVTGFVSAIFLRGDETGGVAARCP